MASGSISVTTGNQYIRGTISWSSVSNQDGNYSDVTATLRLSRTNSGYTTSGSGTFNVTINGTAKSTSKYYVIKQNSNTLMATGAVRVYHNEDGSKSIAISAGGSIPGILTMNTQSDTAILDTIPRGSSLAVSPSTVVVNGENALTAAITPELEDVTHRITYSLGTFNQSYDLGVAELTHTFTPPAAWADQITEASAPLSVSLQTYKGTSTLGTPKNATVTAFTPAYDIQASVILTPVNAINNLYVQGRSSIQFEITAESSFGGSVVSYETVVDGTTYSGSSFTTNALTSAGPVSYTITITDSRNVSKSLTGSVNVEAYSPPYITSISAERSDANGVPTPTGSYAVVSFAGGISSIDGNNTPNYSVSVGSQTTPIAVTSPTINTQIVVDNIATDENYTITVAVGDDYSSVSQSVNIPVAQVPIDIHVSNKGVGIGKVSEKENLLDVAWDLDVTGDVNITGSYLVNGSPLTAGVQIDVLWENASPSSTFDAQTISVDLSHYSHYAIVGVVGTSSGTYYGRAIPTSFAPVGTSALMTFAWGDIDRQGHRTANPVGTTGLAFTGAYYAENINNNMVIPLQILGIKAGGL